MACSINMTVSPEKFLISSVLRNQDMSVALAAGVGTPMFHDYPEEWEWMESVFSKHKKTPSKAAFKDQFPEFVIKAVEDTGLFSDKVRQAHSRRTLLSSMEEVATLIADERIEEAVALGHSAMVKVAATMGANNDSDVFANYDDILADASRRLTRVEETGAAGIPTGFETVDDRTGGPQPGDFWVVGARLGEGKSWTLQRMATAAVMKGYTIQFDALEQTRPQVVYRIHSFMASEAGMKMFKTMDLMQGRNFKAKDYEEFLRKLKARVKGKLHISDTSRGRVGLTTIAAQIEKNDPDVVYIDYLTLMEKKGGDWQDVAALSAGIKVLAQQYQIPIISAAQLNRNAAGGKEPAGPEDLAQSDAIGQDADAVITIKQNSPSTMQMKMAKNRNGAGGFKWYVHFDPANGKMEEVGHDRFLQLQDQDAEAAQASGKKIKRLQK